MSKANDYPSILREHADKETDPGLIKAPILIEIAEHIDNQAERIKELEAVMQKCIDAMKDSNCLEEQWLIKALKG